MSEATGEFGDEKGDEIVRLLLSRRSVRRYRNVEVDYDTVGRLIQAAMNAPTAGNVQSARSIIIMDLGKRTAIAKSCFEQMWMAEAPIHIIVCCEIENIQRMYGIRGERLYGIQDCAAYAENIITAATAYGLGTCWVGGFNEDELKSIAGIPDNARPQCIITVGYPAEEREAPPKFQMTNVAFLESYGNRYWNVRKDVFYQFSPNVESAVTKGRGVLGKITDFLDNLGKKKK